MSIYTIKCHVSRYLDNKYYRHIVLIVRTSKAYGKRAHLAIVLAMHFLHPHGLLASSRQRHAYVYIPLGAKDASIQYKRGSPDCSVNLIWCLSRGFFWIRFFGYAFAAPAPAGSVAIDDANNIVICHLRS